MPRRRWSREQIIAGIRELRARGSDLTPSAVAARDGALVSAAERYFGSWPQAVEAAGIDYEQVRDCGRRRRAASITKWSRARIVHELTRLHRAGEDLSWSVMERKYPALCAAAVKPAYFGGWGAALAAAGIEYQQVKRDAREARRRRARWRRELSRVQEVSVAGEPSPQQRPPTAPPGWAQELLREKAAERRRPPGT